MIDIRPARIPDDLPQVRQLFRAYAEGLGFDLAFQDFEAEVAALPGKYAEPAGRLLLAWRGDQAIGCVALRPVDATTAEMKRLYVLPGERGGQLGRRLAERICDEARAAGYARICLDTIPSMAAAVALYRSLGFEPTAPYVYNPMPEALFLARAL
jgi:GNAT superfamily N-acetyltransferase